MDKHEMYAQESFVKATEMAAVFLLNSKVDKEDGVHYLNDEGFEQLTLLFENVAPPFRAAVFVDFLAILDRVGVEYDKEQFSPEA